MSRTRLLVGILLLVIGSTSTVGIANAQGGESLQTLRILETVAIPVRNAVELAQRFSGLGDALDLLVAPAPDYHIGDRKTFFVGSNDNDFIFEVEAELAAATPGVYLWVETGVAYDADSLAETARFLDDDLFPSVREFFGSEPTPGIDGDPHIYILNVTNIGRNIGGYFNDNSVYPQQVFDTSNEHEMFVIAVDNVPFNSSSYPYVLAHEFVHMIQHNEDENEETWVTEGTAELGAFLTINPRTFAIERFLQNPTLQLNAWDIDNPTPHYGAASLFFTYLAERFGPEFALQHSQEPANGITGVSNVIRSLALEDPLLGETVTFESIYADWLAANILNNTTVADGRYGYELLNLNNSRARLSVVADQYPAILQDHQINQYGADYILLESDTPRTLTVNFSGSTTVPVVPTEPHSGLYFYWANRSDQSNTRLTRAFDLSGVDSATLNFWTWFEMEPFWDYGYVSLSTDGGTTWNPLDTSSTTAENPHGRAFAPGITGFSVGGTEVRPAPFMGINYDTRTGTVTGLIPDGGAAEAGFNIGDQIKAIDGVSLVPEDLIQRLNEYYVNDQVAFTVLRDSSELELTVTLAEHPDRTLRPQARWTQESVDLTPFVGQDVLVRFEYVTDQAFTRNGWVLDDISIPEIGFFDDAESDSGGWNVEGWSRIVNMLPQEYLVEMIAIDGEQTVTRLIMPGDGHEGTWTIDVGPDSRVLLVVSGMTQYTTQPATYDLRMTAD